MAENVDDEGEDQGHDADDDAVVRLREQCSAFGMTPRASDPVVDNAAQAPSTLGAGVA